MGVSKKFQDRFKGVSRKFLGIVSKIEDWNFKVDSRVFQKNKFDMYSMEVSKVFLGCFKFYSASRKFMGVFKMYIYGSFKFF